MSSIQWGPVVAGAVLLAVGAAAYAGVAADWWRTLWPRPTVGFGLWWWGLGAMLVGFGWAGLSTAAGALLLGMPALLCWLVGLASFVWMPRALQPGWYRDGVRR